MRTALAAAGAVLLLTPAGKAGPSPPTAGPGLPSPPIPWLTAAERSEAARSLASDPRTTAIFAGASYTVADIGPFTTTDQRKIGAAMTIRLDAPRSFPVVEWPAIETDWKPGSASRTTASGRFRRATAVRDFDVLVDLNRARLVSLRPRNAEKMKIAPGMAPWPAASGD